MTDLPTTPPSAWRLIWSPQAMAWWARYRTRTALRLGTAFFGLWWGLNAGWFSVTSEEPFGQPAASTLASALGVALLFVLLLHAWSCRPGLKASRNGGSAKCAAVTLASIPATLIDAPDSLLSLYRDAAHFATFDPANPVWHPLPGAVEALTQTCLWFVITLMGWVVIAGLALTRLDRMSQYEPTA
ncbi:MAG: hypothetical protein AAGI68_09415 [Planctomycetota bacterium]